MLRHVTASLQAVISLAPRALSASLIRQLVKGLPQVIRGFAEEGVVNIESRLPSAATCTCERQPPQNQPLNLLLSAPHQKLAGE